MSQIFFFFFSFEVLIGKIKKNITIPFFPFSKEIKNHLINICILILKSFISLKKICASNIKLLNKKLLH